MRFQEMIQTLKKGWLRFWRWLSPYLKEFYQWFSRIWRKYHFTKIIILVSLVAILITSTYLFYVAKTTNVEELSSGLKESTVFFDRYDQEAGKFRAEKSENYVDLEQISPHVIDALISTEDRRFYEHHGFDLKGIARAGVRMVVNRSTVGGGGSTITQQLAKNAYLTLDQTFTRKAKEIFLAIEIEKKYSKDEILAMYLNNSYFGSGVWGIQDASKKYFGVDAANLSIGQAATLVGLLKGPSIYNPIDNLEAAKNRRDTVLSVMVDNGKLTQEAATDQMNLALGDQLYDAYNPEGSGYQYPYYFDAVIDEAVRLYGLDGDDVMKRGYKIYTALDQNYQSNMQNIFAQDGYFPPNGPNGDLVQTASVALDPNTGGIQGLIGRRGDYTFRGFNFAIDMQRSPGSTIKPLSVYTPALEAGYKPDSLLKDEPQSYYEAKNFDGTYQGEAPMYEAVAQSLNLPAVWLLHELGLTKGYNKAKEFGLPLVEEDKYWGLSLGGLKHGTSPAVMASAYGVFANGGTLYTPHLITKIIDSTGAVIVDKTQPKGKQVISKETSDEMTSMLLGTYSNGTGVSAAPTNYTIAGKTGTTESSFDTSKSNDQWMIAYTPDVVLSTWIGFETSSETNVLHGTGGENMGALFKAQAEGVLPYTAQTPFAVANAYWTGGKIQAADEVTAPTEESEQTDRWKEELEDFTDRALQKGKEVGKKAIEKGKDVLRGLRDFLP
ncbi:PBP1A family penicillin-binding protein [Enterococcus sp. LJL98]